MEQMLMRALMGTPQKDSTDKPSHPDTSETVNISALALIKMLKHARAGVPLEVMGLMLGTFVDDYTINVVDVFAMPQSGTSVTVESVDPVYQTKHMDLLKQTGRAEMVVGWYHSHPGFGCWLSSVDVQTQQSFEALHPRAIAVVVDPIQSVKGKVMLEAFRSIDFMALNPKQLAPTGESRQCTGNMGSLQTANLISTLHGLGRKYYDLTVNYKLSEREQKMLNCLNQLTWSDAMRVANFTDCSKKNHDKMVEMVKMTDHFAKDIQDKKKLTTTQVQLQKYGRLNSKQKLEQVADSVMKENIMHEIKSIVNSHSMH